MSTLEQGNCMTAIFLYIGMDAERRRTEGQAWPPNSLGFIKIPGQCQWKARLIDRWVKQYGDEIFWQGDFEEAVAEPMGVWMYKNFEVRDHEFIAEFDRRMLEWGA